MNCKSERMQNYIGYYELDKTVIKNEDNKQEDYTILEINADNTFALRKDKKDSVNTIHGKYKIVKDNSKEKIFQFIFHDKQIQAKLKGTIFYFTYPNDFNNDKYKYALYVKLKM